MSTFYSNILYISKQQVVAMRYVESLRFPDGEELTAERLVDDLYLHITTVSGNEYKLSINLQRICNNAVDVPLKEYRNSIYNRWKYILENK